MTAFETGGFRPAGQFAHMERWLEAEIALGRMSGAVTLVHHKGRLIHSSALGFRDKAHSRLMTEDTIFWIASMTKPVTSLAALMLAEQGRLLLSEPVSTYLPEFENVRVLTGNNIDEALPTDFPPTIQHLLTHTSGLTYGPFGDDTICAAYRETGVYDFASTNQEMSVRLADLPLAYHPGTCFEYGMSTDLLGRVIEVVSESTLPDFIGRRIAAPLAMADTGFSLSPDQRGRLAEVTTSMTESGLCPPVDEAPVWHSGGGGLWSTARDYLAFALMLLSNGKTGDNKIVSPSTIRHMRSNHLPPGISFGNYAPELGATAPCPSLGQGFGLGLAVRLETGRNPLPGAVGDASWPGVSGTNFWIDPENELAVVFMTHAPQWRIQHRAALRQLVYAALDD
ncbi:serine hydrolase domain-containing protein [Hoeflea sp. TYP-13]|uniref:serine hydrolase domain-containing protein n=1 Tax=Hoeflea sp. TYP-13 TaxID=3230023 RepID=UPI0034C5BB3D